LRLAADERTIEPRRIQQMNRRQIIQTAALGSYAFASAQTGRDESKPARKHLSSVTAKDGTNVFVQDWGSGRPVVFLAAWAFNSNVWGSHIAALTGQGFRCVALDRRGHGRSDIPGTGYDLDTLAGDLAAVMEQLDLRQAVLVAHSMGTAEAVRYCVRHGMDRVARLVLAAPITPYLTKTADNPEGIPAEMIQAQYDSIANDYPKWIGENEAPFFTPDTVAETRNWIKGMMLDVPLPVGLACRRAIAAADLRTDLRKIVRPTLIVHGGKDASAPISITGARTARLIANSRFTVYEDAPHAIVLTHRERFIRDMLDFIAE
jgi:non-heme chloroperoxidase